MGKILFWATLTIPALYYLFLVVRSQLQRERAHKEWLDERGGKKVKLKWDLKDLAGCILICTALTLGAMWPMVRGWLDR